MPDVLYPEDLQRLGALYDQLCTRLNDAGVEYTPEMLARRLVECADELAQRPNPLSALVKPVGLH